MRMIKSWRGRVAVRKTEGNQKPEDKKTYLESYSTNSFWDGFIVFELIGMFFDLVFTIIGAIFSDSDI